MWRVAQRVTFTLYGGARGDYLDTDPMVDPVVVAPVRGPAQVAAISEGALEKAKV